jgi:hypothetical protein
MTKLLTVKHNVGHKTQYLIENMNDIADVIYQAHITEKEYHEMKPDRPCDGRTVNSYYGTESYWWHIV